MLHWMSTFATTPGATNGLLNNLVSYYDLENGNDVHGSNNGTINGATTVAGKIGNAQSFDGVNDYISVPDNATLDLISGYTINAWVRLDASFNDYGGVFTKDSDTNGRAFSAHIKNTKQQRWYINGGGGTDEFVESSFVLNTEEWYMLTYKHTGTRLEIWRNGVLDTFTGNSTPNTNSVAARVGIGDMEFSTFRIFMDGEIDEVGVWDRDLSSDDIAALYNSGSGLAYSAFTS